MSDEQLVTGVERKRIDDYVDALRRLKQENHALKRDRDNLESLWRQLVGPDGFVQFDEQDTRKAFIVVMGGKRYLPDKMAAVCFAAFDYLYGRVNHDTETDQHHY